MEYELVYLEEKTVAGIRARTNNFSPDMAQVIGGRWGKFYGEQIYESLPRKKGCKALGIYSGYENKEKGDYDITVACEVEESGTLPDGVQLYKIPAGKYAKFIVKGELHEAVGEFWEQLWKMKLPRTFVCDFEEYQTKEADKAEIHMYIGVK